MAKNRAQRIVRSPNYKQGAFQNISLTPVMAENTSYYKVLKAAIRRPGSVRPPKKLPSVKTDLRSIHLEKPVIVWFGHSSYFIHVAGTNILVDPVLSGHASPFKFMVKAFEGTDIYETEDFPPIDIMLITHNHYDHLDKKIMQKMMPDTKAFYTSLGVGEDLEKCGIDPEAIHELDWWETVAVSDDTKITATPARHFSGRGLKRGGSLWSSFVLQIKGYKIYIGGDSGYDEHFKKIGEKFGPFDIAMLECGQYNPAWPYIHMMPEQTVQAAVDLHTKLLLPVHWGKFALANHPWNEPIQRALKAGEEKHVNITTPKIGEPVVIGEDYPKSEWWKL